MDVIISSDELNYKLNKYVFDTFPLFQDDFALEEKFLDISVSEYYKFTNFLKKDPYQMKKKLSVDSSIDIVLKFFFQLDKNYGELFKECLDKNMIYLNESKGNDENSYFQDDGEEKSINIFLHHSIVDVFSLAHEFMHFTNDLDCADSTGSYFTEVFSSYIELLLSDFLIKNYPEYKKDTLNSKRLGFQAVIETNLVGKIFFEILKQVIDGKEINNFCLNEIKDDLKPFISNDNYEFFLYETLDKMNGNLEEMMLETFRYALALPLATYLYNYNFKEVIDLNNIINDYFPEEFFLYLGLNFKKEEFILEDNEFKKINKIYHEYVKKLW